MKNKALIISAIVFYILSFSLFCYADSPNDVNVGPGLTDMQVAGTYDTGFPATVTSNGLTIKPDFDNPVRCSLNTDSHVTIHYNFPKINFVFENDPAKTELVNQHFNFLIMNNMTDILTNNYKNKYYTNEYFYWGTKNKRRNWTMNKVGLKTFDGNIIELEFSSPDYKNDGMVNIKASYDIANNILTVK